MSVLGAWRSAVGCDELDTLFTGLDQTFTNCTSYVYELQAYDVSGDMAYTVGLEHTSASVNGQPRTYTLRATQVYRRESARRAHAFVHSRRRASRSGGFGVPPPWSRLQAVRVRRSAAPSRKRARRRWEKAISGVALGRRRYPHLLRTILRLQDQEHPWRFLSAVAGPQRDHRFQHRRDRVRFEDGHETPHELRPETDLRHPTEGQ
ncbi:nuclear transport factor 2 family protein [Streptomyces yangpuensis]|uniref:nuclear transport factor 2 family protein n=1 Tax=Streptomyces yangpuensis TaxID=1648182 RepID=UPI00363001ED